MCDFVEFARKPVHQWRRTKAAYASPCGKQSNFVFKKNIDLLLCSDMFLPVNSLFLFRSCIFTDNLLSIDPEMRK